MVEVLKNLYIGDKIDAYMKSTLEKLKIKYIINCANEIENRFEGEYNYYSIKAVEDGKFQMINHFNKCGKIINNSIK